ncbi:MAG TPA: DUF5916 domain-containing protein [Oligoflexus sp.]|uniref:carbohydrate binding family 9 domain-containing protein n=1 Tax=Oligoflexus sp. TaxID=1971216 RepID=UPI002D235B3A|nr:DUF5916 domain-containing protein [Oligoflexus sp.]HYX36440.1 DUF5916 domain-containing protein [Oligoflexus sp.]
MHETLLVLALQAIRWPADTAPVIDGRLDEPFWQTIAPAEQIYQVLPEAGLPASFRTTVRFALDTDNFYIGASLEDPSGSERQSNVSRRDHIPDTDDTLTIILDPLGTRVFGQLFQVNPDCATSDGLYMEASLSTDLSTDFHYTVACHQSDRGWTVEFKIPLQELRFAQGNTQPWNVLVQRSLVRDQRRTVANAPLPRDPLCLLCLAPSLDSPAALPEPNFLRLTPYALFRRTDRARATHGLDIKYRVSSEAIMDATVNPDFSQMNLDEPQLSANTLFAVSSPENRPFFLEGADILESPLKVVATRSITQPSWGLKYTRRSQTHDTMILSGDDRSDNRILLPGAYGSRYHSLRAQQKYLIGSSHWKGEGYHLGMTLTHRSYEDLGSNQTLGLAAMHYLSPEDSLRWQSILSVSHDRWADDNETQGDAHYVLLQHKGAIWQSSLELKSFSRDFRSDLGFNPRNNYRLGIVTNSLHQQFGEKHVAWYLRLSRKTELAPRPIQSQSVPGVTLSGFWGTEITLETRPATWERIRADGVLHRYQQHYASLGLYPGSMLTWLQCDLTWGERLDVTDNRVRPGRVEGCAARLAIGKKLEWNASWSQELLLQEPGLGTAAPILTNRVLRHLMVLPFDAHWSLRYIRQEERAQRLGAPESRATTDSWNLSFENPQFLSLHTGATQARESSELVQDYYVKLSAPIR